jgi:HEAT repeat protein
MKQETNRMTALPRLGALLAAALTLAPCLALAQATPDRAEETRKQIAVLQSGSGTFAKAEACRTLALLGSAEAVPALAALLPDRQLSAHARTALEIIADPAAATALRSAMGSLSGDLRLGAVGSVGARRDAKAVTALLKFAASPDAALSAAALAALGKIATPEASGGLQRALASPRPETRTQAADATLTFAARLVAVRSTAQAIRLYAAVQGANVAQAQRLAAGIGIIAARWSVADGASRKQALTLLAGQVRSPDPAAIRAGLMAVRSMEGPEVTGLLAAQMPQVAPEVQMLLVRALLERTDPGALTAVETLASSPSAPVRAAAVAALAGMGRLSSVPVLLKAIEAGRSDEETVAAAASLTRLTAEGADQAIVARLPQASPAIRARLVTVLGKRRAVAAADAVLKAAADPDASVRKAAYGALTELARPGDLAAIVKLAATDRDEGARQAAGQALRAAAAKHADPGSRSAPMLAELRAASDAPTRSALLRMLGEVGGLQALKAVREALKDGSADIRAAAIQSLADWPDPSATAALLSHVRTAADAGEKVQALRGAIGQAGALAAELPRPSRQLIGWFTEANKAVGADAGDRRRILAALGDLKCPEALAMVEPYLSDSSVAAEAAAAKERLAKAVPAALPRSGDDPDPEKLAYAPIFDGSGFTGWEGDTTKAFRIEEGAIVGGSLAAPVARNEFLCTTRPYADYVLRMEVRLKNANGGIQIRSRRVPDSPEVSGYQADMDTGGAYWGCLYDESRRGMLVQADQAKVLPSVKKDDWNTYEIRCQGPRIRLFVNGVQTVDYTEADEDVLHSGIIAVQVHGGAPSETWYRNIRIAELP